MIQDRTFVITDPRNFEGDPYQVAERAARQCQALAEILLVSLDASERMARNAHMQRGEAAKDWPGSAEGQRWTVAKDEATTQEKRLGALARAASFDPEAAL